MQSDSFSEISAHVKSVNEYASRIAQLNTEIVSVEATGTAANDLRDQREMAIRELADLMETRVHRAFNNGVTDILSGGHLLGLGW